MSTRHLAFAIAGAALLALGTAGPARAASFSLIDPADVTGEQKLFTTEVKMDQIHSGDSTTEPNSVTRRGHDVFLRNASETTGSSRDEIFLDGTTVDWVLGYDGDVATFSVAGSAVTPIDIDPDGSVNAIKLIARAAPDDGKLPADAAVTITLDTLDGMAITGVTSLDASLGEFNEILIGSAGFDDSWSLAGTVTFDWTGAHPGAANSRWAFNLKALEITVPEPTVFLMLAPAVASLVVARRSRRSR